MLVHTRNICTQLVHVLTGGIEATANYIVVPVLLWV